MQAFLVHFKSVFPAKIQAAINEIPAQCTDSDQFKEYKALMHKSTQGRVLTSTHTLGLLEKLLANPDLMAEAMQFAFSGTSKWDIEQLIQRIRLIQAFTVDSQVNAHCKLPQVRRRCHPSSHFCTCCA
jgi:hypothetical protein